MRVCIALRLTQLEDPVLDEHSYLFFGTIAALLEVGRLSCITRFHGASRYRVTLCLCSCGVDCQDDPEFVKNYVSRLLEAINSQDGVTLADSDDDDDDAIPGMGGDDDDGGDGDDEGADDDDDDSEDDDDGPGEQAELYPGKMINMRIKSQYLEAKVRGDRTAS